MTEEEKRNYVQKLMHDVQKARSIFYESNRGDSERNKMIADTIGELSEPWLFGKRCVLPTLAKVLDGEIEDSTLMNLSTIADRSQMLRIIGVSSKRHDPTMEEIFGLDQDIS